MWSILARILFITPLLAGCATAPPQNVDAQQFQPVADKAVIYLYRERLDHGSLPATLHFGDQLSGTTYRGTYYRWETAPGQRRIEGYGPDTGAITINAAAGKVYYVEQSTWQSRTSALSSFRLVDEQTGRDGVSRAALIAQM